MDAALYSYELPPINADDTDLIMNPRHPRLSAGNSLCYSSFRFSRAKVAELADAPDLGSGTERCGGSSPPFRTK